LPAAVCMMTSVPCLTTLNELHKGISNNKKTVTTTNHVFK
jgi:hypothetical protein